MNEFKWVDLSTFDLGKAKEFYSKVFDWEYQSRDGYVYSSNKNGQVSGLYEMPDKFQKINMPSFWMSYIEVKDLEKIVGKSEEFGGKVEVRSEQFGESGRVALIRDPSGAGFTIYEGELLGKRDSSGIHGSVISNELYVSRIDLVKNFYEGVFDWRVEQEKGVEDRYDIHSFTGKKIAAIEVVDNKIKGKKEFWAVYFAVDDLDKARQVVNSSGGKVLSSNNTVLGRVVMVTDPFNATLFLVQGFPNNQVSFKWKALMGLAGVYLAIVFGWTWFWGILLLSWVILDLRQGSTYFFDQVYRRENPLLYAALMISWFWMAMYLLLV